MSDGALATYGRFEIGLGQDAYPRLLADIPRPPQRLYGYGDPAALTGGLAVVGARKATPYGLGCAAMFAARAASCGIGIISGGAIGCDQSALSAAVDQGAAAVFVAAGGADVIYPSGAARLISRMLDVGGVLVSEQPWGSIPLRYRFVARNRIIAGLALATLVVEAGLPSGTFSTADAAIEAGREVLAVPGCIHSPESRGSNRLIRDGAQPVIDMECFDVLIMRIFGVLPALVGTDVELNRVCGLPPDQARLVALLAANPSRLDEIVEQTGMDMRALTVLMSRCEAYGIVERYRDGRYGVPVAHRTR